MRKKPLPPSSGPHGHPPTLACAIYTRKSSEEGLEQDFNSLHAQREACEAYVLSQKSLGWLPIATTYDDGGYSGGNTERPALRRLIADIEAGKVRVIVVYKVDRLTRSLADFAKLVELFDAQGVSFVSVTQQFNTTTSMGRLTLNVLLSFAQFEREVTGERIRDKIAASKRKGLWMGGVPPVGYQAKGRTLEPLEPHASRIRQIYALYLELNCVRRLSEALQQKNWLTPERQHRRAGFGGNKPFSRGHLYRILSNPIYAGRVAHRDEVHPGQHPAIVDEELWQRVQQRLADNRQGTKTRSHASHPSLLAGKLVDETGRRLVPSHARKGHKRYRYYVTPADEPGEPIRLPADELEQVVVQAIVDWAAREVDVIDAVGWHDAQRASDALKRAETLTHGLRYDPRTTLPACISEVEIAPTRMRLRLDLVGAGFLPEGSPQAETVLDVPAQRKRCGMAVRLVIGDQDSGNLRLRQPDSGLVDLMGKSRGWLHRLTFGGQSIGAIAQEEQASPQYVARVINVGLLAPDIVQAIERGDHAIGLNATRLLTSVPLPMDWQAQREMLGMG